ncbi:hypothetical protein BDA96_09G233500 [Sorghum bicolor]|uniref:Uncharacterized protein n=1 Tax=Sorghum bicolor TaxID=4558 RepID=A0A921QE61_SORBI|nr:hypothetical protein BDA96_09G233500 [Sorghum bicolor]
MSSFLADVATTTKSVGFLSKWQWVSTTWQNNGASLHTKLMD